MIRVIIVSETSVPVMYIYWCEVVVSRSFSFTCLNTGTIIPPVVQGGNPGVFLSCRLSLLHPFLVSAGPHSYLLYLSQSCSYLDLHCHTLTPWISKPSLWPNRSEYSNPCTLFNRGIRSSAYKPSVVCRIKSIAYTWPTSTVALFYLFDLSCHFPLVLLIQHAPSWQAVFFNWIVFASPFSC